MPVPMALALAGPGPLQLTAGRLFTGIELSLESPTFVSLLSLFFFMKGVLSFLVM